MSTFDRDIVSGKITWPVSDSHAITAFDSHAITAINPLTVTGMVENHIQGNVFSATIDVTEFDLINVDNYQDQVKKKLAHMIAEKLLEKKHIEFTVQHNAVTGGRTFRARLFAVPDTQVRILRERKMI